MKTLTFYSTPHHGYLSVSKKDILELGIDPKLFSQYSGMTLNRVFLEEDQDASLFLHALDEAGIEYQIQEVYKETHSVRHNYNAELFNYQPKINDRIVCGNTTYKVISSSLKIVDDYGNVFKIPKSNPFKYIEKVLD